MPKLMQDDSGQIYLDEGGGILTPMTEAEATAYHEGRGVISGAAKTANKALEAGAAGLLGLFDDDYKQQAIAGQEQLRGMTAANPIASGAAQYLPQVTMGAATAGAGILPTAGAEALMGAATNPQAPGQGALVGGLLGGTAAALPGVVGAVVGKGKQVANKFRVGASLPDDAMQPGVLRPDAEGLADEALIPGAAEAPPSPSAPTAPPGTYASNGGQPPRMAERVAQTIEREAGQDVAATRVMGDLMTPDELAQYNIPVNPGQRALLEATTADPQSAVLARRLMADEEARRSSPALGAGINEVMDRQRVAATNFINHQLDVPQGAALTEGTVSEVLAGIGNRLDDIADEMGGVPMTTPIRDELTEIMRLSAGRHTGTLQETIDNALKKADNNGGLLTGQDWQIMRTELNKQITKGVRDGKIDWVNEANDVMEVLTRAMESKLPAGSAAELRKLRKQYAIAATLTKPGTRNPDGLINPTSFYSNWKRPQSLKHRGKDDVGRFMNTMNVLTQKRTPDSGTATRLARMAEDMGYSIPIVGPLARGLLGGGG